MKFASSFHIDPKNQFLLFIYLFQQFMLLEPGCILEVFGEFLKINRGSNLIVWDMGPALGILFEGSPGDCNVQPG